MLRKRDGVLEEFGDGDGAYAAGDRSEESTLWRTSRIGIATELAARFGGASINQTAAVFEHVGSDEAGRAGTRDDDVRGAERRGKVGSCVTYHRDLGTLLAEPGSHRRTYQEAFAHHHRVFPCHFHAALLKNGLHCANHRR